MVPPPPHESNHQKNSKKCVKLTENRAFTLTRDLFYVIAFYHVIFGQELRVRQSVEGEFHGDG